MPNAPTTPNSDSDDSEMEALVDDATSEVLTAAEAVDALTAKDPWAHHLGSQSSQMTCCHRPDKRLPVAAVPNCEYFDAPCTIPSSVEVGIALGRVSSMTSMSLAANWAAGSDQSSLTNFDVDHSPAVLLPSLTLLLPRRIWPG